MSEIIYTGKETLQPLATKIKTLGGVEDSITLAEMEDSVKAANEGLAAQATTISEIAALLEGKSVPGGGGAVLETCKIKLANSSPANIGGLTAWTYIDNEGNIGVKQAMLTGNAMVTGDEYTTEIMAVCNSVIYCSWSSVDSVTITNGAEIIYNVSPYNGFGIKTPNIPNVVCEISYTRDD